jgi:hypothetical protein
VSVGHPKHLLERSRGFGKSRGSSSGEEAARRPRERVKTKPIRWIFALCYAP